MVVMVIVGSASRGVEGGDAVKVQHKIFPVAHRGVALVTWNPHCTSKEGRHLHICQLYLCKERGEDINSHVCS